MKTKLFVLSLALVLTSCASTKLRPEAESVVVSEMPPSAECKLVGEVDAYTHVNVSNTSNNVLVNLIKNNAHDLGGNYVQLDEATKLKHRGRAFSCP